MNVLPVQSEIKPGTAGGIASVGTVAGPVNFLFQALGTPGIYHDRQEGHTYSRIDEELAALPRRSALVVVPSHDEAEAAAGRIAGAVAYPRRLRSDGPGTGGNCRNFDEVERAAKAGLSPGEAVCPGCAWREGCAYLRDCAAASEAAVMTCVPPVAAADPLGRTEFRDALFVVGGVVFDTISFVRQAAECRATMDIVASDLRRIIAAADDCLLKCAEFRTTTDEDGRRRMVEVYDDPVAEAAKDFWRHVAATAQRVCSALHQMRDRFGQQLVEREEVVRVLTERTGVNAAPHVPSVDACDQPQRLDAIVVYPPRAWATSFWVALRGREPTAGGTLVRLILSLCLGRVNAIECTFGCTPGGLIGPTIRGVFTTPLPRSIPVVFFDAQATPEELANVSGRMVVPIGEGRPLAVPDAVQAVERMSRSTSPAKAVAMVRGVMLSRPGERVGVLCHRALWPRVQAELSHSRFRPHRYAFWRGDVRPLSDCDIVLVLGTPTVSADAIRRRLVLTGRYDAADRNPCWGELPWQATDTTGETVLVPRSGYADPDWQAVHERILRGEFRRTVEVIGRRVVVLADEDLGLPIVGRSPRLATRDARIVCAISDAIQAGVGLGDVPPVSEEEYSSLLRKQGVHLPTLHQATGLSVKTLRSRLSVLRRAGFVVYLGRSVGWSLPAVAGPSLPAPPSMAKDPGVSFDEHRNPLGSGKDADAALVVALVALADEGGGEWSGTPASLDASLAVRSVADSCLADWVGCPERVGLALKRLGARLVEQGVVVERGRRTKAGRLVSLRRA